jgi:hypothetical protein
MPDFNINGTERRIGTWCPSAGVFQFQYDQLSEGGSNWAFRKTELGMKAKSDQVVDLDPGSDINQLFGGSYHLQVGRVVFNFLDPGARHIVVQNCTEEDKPEKMVREAMKHIEFFAWCPGHV